MASRQVLLKDLKVGDLKRELDERDIDSSGKKAELQLKLREALFDEGEDPDTYMFEFPGAVDLTSLITKFDQMENKIDAKLDDNSLRMESKLEDNSASLKQQIEDNSAQLKQQIEAKLEDNARSLKRQIAENCGVLEQKFKGEIANLDQEFRREINRLEKQMADIKNTGIGETGIRMSIADHDNLSDIGEERSEKAVERVKMKWKPPQFDGKSSWNNYHIQFEAAARANRWTSKEKAFALILGSNILQTLSVQEQDDYDQLVQRLDTRYGQSSGIRLPLPLEEPLSKIR